MACPSLISNIDLHRLGRYFSVSGESSNSDINKLAVWAATSFTERVIELIVGEVKRELEVPQHLYGGWMLLMTWVNRDGDTICCPTT
jgi:hypothetical protein